MAFHSIFDSSWDVIVIGAGYSGFAAAWQCHTLGKRVLLLDREPALLRESAWSFSHRTGSSCNALWQEWMNRLYSRGGARDGICDGAIAEVLATELCLAQSWPVLYYAAPVAAEYRGELLESLFVATKSGLRRLSAARWIDATEQGEVLQLLQPDWRAPEPEFREWHLYFRSVSWPETDSFSLGDSTTLDLRLSWQRTVWPNERVLRIRSTNQLRGSLDGWLPGLRALRGSGRVDLAEAVLTHGSVLPFQAYPKTLQPPVLPANVAVACASLAGPGSATLAGRFDAGINAVLRLEAQPGVTLGKVRPEVQAAEYPQPGREINAEVVVAGLGTGGALAAVTAARAGAQVAAFDALPFPGGISTGGGIHYYWYGVRGGLQEELDERVRDIMPLFGTTAQVRGFHPDAKKLVLQSMLAEAGVECHHGATLYNAEGVGERVEQVHTSGPYGPIRWRANSWVDATGDGDLSVLAGAGYHCGREGDGRLAAYSQSSGRAHIEKGRAAMEVINFDAGFCDPSDAEDLTRARLHGVSHYIQKHYDSIERPNYIAPAIGLRQSRHIETDYTVTLADLVARRVFPDAVGYSGGHFDSHARDFEFESDEAVFWVWVCQQHGGGLSSDIPYRALLPQGLENVVLGCRALGMSTDAHYCVRMQRDMQRVGEAAGAAAALAARNGGGVREIDYSNLRTVLMQTGALKPVDVEEDSFGPRAQPSELKSSNPANTASLADWLRDLQSAPSGPFLWSLYQARELALEPLLELLGAEDELVSWRAAAVLAMWGDSRAEPRLARAICRREGGDAARELANPQHDSLFVPRWLIAISLLRRCGTPQWLPVLEELAEEPELYFNARTAIALTAAGIIRRHPPCSQWRPRWEIILDALVATPAPGAVRQIQSKLPVDAVALSESVPSGINSPRDRAVEDFSWQLHLAVGKARLEMGLPLHAAGRIFLDDPNRLVRNAFAALENAGAL